MDELITSVAAMQGEFLQAVRGLRPKLHRFCARMCGSALDGEDVVQEALAQAFFHLPSLKDRSRLEPWLYRIAYRKCVDFLRHERRRREDTVPLDEEDDPGVASPEPDSEPIGATLAPLVSELPPKERAAVLLKDILEYRLSEVADVVDSTVGGVKAALHRGRARLRALQAAPSAVELDRRQERLLGAYVDCFNRRDWDALRRLVHADASLQVVEAVDGKLADAGYFATYASLPWEWKLEPGLVDGEPVIVHWKKIDGSWRAHAAIRVWWRGDKIVRIRDYAHVDYLLGDTQVEPAPIG